MRLSPNVQELHRVTSDYDNERVREMRRCRSTEQFPSPAKVPSPTWLEDITPKRSKDLNVRAVLPTTEVEYVLPGIEIEVPIGRRSPVGRGKAPLMHDEFHQFSGILEMDSGPHPMRKAESRGLGELPELCG